MIFTIKYMFGNDEEEKLGSVNSVLWWIGWHPAWVIFLGVLLYIVGGLLIWLGAVFYINRRYQDVQTEYVELVDARSDEFASQVGPEVNLYSLIGGTDSLFLLRPDEEYRATHLLIGDTSVTIQKGIRMSMVSRIPMVKDSSREIYYDQISSVSYDAPRLEIRTSDGDTLSYLSSRRPDDALRDLQNRLRSYKSTTEKATV